MSFGIGSTIRVKKLAYGTGQVVYAWSGALVHEAADELVVHAIFPQLRADPPVVDGVPFNRGDIFTEFYYPDRWYNVFHIADPSGVHKGWYCNIAQPATVDDEGIGFVDMALDLFVHPDGRATVLDEDEFAVAMASLYVPADALRARQGLEELIQVVKTVGLPSPRDRGLESVS